MNPPPRLAAALRAVERGWPVFPLHPYSKSPAVPDWPHRATCNLDQITRWWASAPYNIAIACQAAGLVVIDLDAGHGHPPPPQWAGLGVTHGRDVLRILAQRAGHPDPIDTYTVATPSGEHRYFLAPADRELRNTTGATSSGLGWCIICSRSWCLLLRRVYRDEGHEARLTRRASALVAEGGWISGGLAGGGCRPARWDLW